ncbi:hypothetical protein GCM10010532_036390 [Dactylosporangium siamense]|uniref:Uncharacterized protein n=1 Tax=Dactylosporangium siamense TaxID=685454 RepID=A0A919PLX8_9ACTN|nr:hypothetical protein Dsi01nite_028810 [Dactylosporangium siamense]
MSGVREPGILPVVEEIRQRRPAHDPALPRPRISLFACLSPRRKRIFLVIEAAGRLSAPPVHNLNQPAHRLDRSTPRGRRRTSRAGTVPASAEGLGRDVARMSAGKRERGVGACGRLPRFHRDAAADAPDRS